MTKDKILTIVRGEEFKINVKKEIEETDIFYEQYVKAARILDDIAASDSMPEVKEWLKTESENNIIAFCGERGEGKSSAMMSFINAAYTSDAGAKRTIFGDCENVKKTLFAEPIVMDPSMFDDVHNVLDIVLATLYRKFRVKYDLDNQCLGMNEREKLLDQFQKVYRCVSLINNQAKMLDNEYDYEGNISKLAKLGESTGLRNELKQLIEQYLNVMLGVPGPDKSQKSLLIAIDDLDLCSSNAYKMTEQIRKYLIIPKVVIIMAVKVEQLQLCVLEENFKSYENIIGSGERKSELFNEMNSMAERYIAKLIPRARRIYLPKVQTILHARILYENKNKEIIFEGSVKDSMNEAVLDYIFLKTGMRFLINKSNVNFLLPDNLRDMVNMITLLGDMEEPGGDNSIYYNNIQRFCDYFEKEWLPSNLESEDYKAIQKAVHNNYIQLHEDAEFALRKFYNMTEKKVDVAVADYFPEANHSFFRVINWLEVFRLNVFGNLEEKYAYAFYILYTIRLNELLRQKEYDEMAKFMGGYIWAGSFVNVLPNVQGNMLSRSRFILPTIRVFNTIGRMLYPDADILLTGTAVTENYVSKISEKDGNREKKIWVWLLLGLLSNTYGFNQSNQIVYTFYTLRVIFPNYVLLQNLHVSLENFMISLCNLTSLYEKINMELLGIEKDEFVKYIENIEMYNKDVIDVFRNILINIDLSLKFKEYCQEHRESRERGIKDEVGMTKAAVDQFFRNVENFADKYLGGPNDDYTRIRFNSLVLDCDKEGNVTEVDISQLYGFLVQACVQNVENIQTNTNNKKKEEEINVFTSKLRERVLFEIPLRVVSSYLRNKSAENVKANMDNLASNIQRYYSKHPEERIENSEIMALSSFYSKIIDLFIEDPKMNISDELHEEYKDIVYKFQKTC